MKLTNWRAGACMTMALCSMAAVAQQSDERPVNLEVSAQMIAQKMMMVDTHIDVPYRLEGEWEDVTRRTEGGDFDYERARAGGLNIPFMSIYTPGSSEEDG